jgi:hypothetical protein
MITQPTRTLTAADLTVGTTLAGHANSAESRINPFTEGTAVTNVLQTTGGIRLRVATPAGDERILMVPDAHVFYAH